MLAARRDRVPPRGQRALPWPGGIAYPRCFFRRNRARRWTFAGWQAKISKTPRRSWSAPCLSRLTRSSTGRRSRPPLRAVKGLLAARVRRNLPLQSRRGPGAGDHRHEVTVRRLYAGISGSPDRNSQGARARLRAPDDLCRSGDAKDLDETGHLVEQVSASVVLASFSQDDHGDEAGSDLLNPAGVFQDAICCGHQTTHPSK
jgi:hypothetical protein